MQILTGQEAGLRENKKKKKSKEHESPKTKNRVTKKQQDKVAK